MCKRKQSLCQTKRDAAFGRNLFCVLDLQRNSARKSRVGANQDESPYANLTAGGCVDKERSSMPRPEDESHRKPMQTQLEAVDGQLAALVRERCEILRAWTERAPDALPTFIESVASSRKIGTGESGEPGTKGQVDSELIGSLMADIAGATYSHMVRPERIAYLGPPHSYSYAAAADYFGPHSGLLPLSSIAAVFEEVARDQAKYGVVPIENSTDGRIADTLTMFAKTPVRICGEILLPIHHNLLARCKREEIRTVYSKPQALSQCRGWLSLHLPNARWSEVASTTAAARIASEETMSAAVASVEAAVAYSLDIIARNIEDSSNNLTRFVVISKDSARPTGHDKTSLMFQVPHQPGALADVMVLFKNNGLNLTWIESFPIIDQPNEYLFFVELEGHQDTPSVAHAIDALRLSALRLECLGSYPKGNGRRPNIP
jgi:chorismate mutase/prephenate dehydratase